MEHKTWERLLNQQQQLYYQTLSPPPRDDRWEFLLYEKLQTEKVDGESPAPKNGKKMYQLVHQVGDWVGLIILLEKPMLRIHNMCLGQDEFQNDEPDNDNG